MRALIVVVCASFLVGCAGSDKRESQVSPEPTASPTAASPTPIARGTEKISPRTSYPPRESLPSFSSVKIASAALPAGLAAAPDGRILYSEFWEGRVRVIRPNGTVDPKPWADVNQLYGIRWTRFYHGGLSGIAFDPDYARNRFVYVVTQVPSKRNGLPSQTYIIRFKEANGRGTAPRIIMVVRAKVFDNVYSLVFGPDGMLYVPSGFLGRSRPKGQDPLADRRGKILRVTPTGAAPGDNPFGARAPRVWASGFKNAFDLAFVPGSRNAVAGESGPEAHDEINLVMPGHDYGYPDEQGVTTAKGVTPPLLDYAAERTSPAGIAYYTGSKHPALRGRYLMCENHGRGLIALRVRTKSPARLLNFTPLVANCTIDIVQTRDGSIVYSDANTIYRLVQR